jgi:hypothetical protein
MAAVEPRGLSSRLDYRSIQRFNPDMQPLIKWTLRLGLALVAILLLGLLLKDSIMRVSLERKIRSRTGMDARIGQFSSGLFSAEVTIRNLKLYNTAEFGGTPFLDVPELHLEFDPVALRRRKLHITLLRLNLNEIAVVKNEFGRTNVVGLLDTVQTNASNPDELRRLLGDLQFTGIDVLNLTLGKARYVDLQNARNNREVNLNFQNQIFKDVKSPGDIYGILFMIWLRSGGGVSTAPTGFQILTLNCSLALSDSTNAASNCGISSRSFKLTTSTGECM